MIISIQTEFSRYFNSTPTKTEEKNTVKNFDIVNNIFNLSRKDFDITEITGLNKEDRDEVIQMVSNLINHKIVGFEILELNKKPYKSFIGTKLSADLSHLKPYKKKLDFFV